MIVIPNSIQNRRSIRWALSGLGFVWLFFFLPAVCGQSIPSVPDLDLVRPGSAHAVHRSADGKIYVGGYFFSVNGVPRRYLARLNPEGSLDTTWAPVVDERVEAILADGGFLYIGGNFASINGVQRRGLARFDLGSGELDLSWNPGLDRVANSYNPSVFALSVQDDYLFVAGKFDGVGGVECYSCARFDLDTGVHDSTWLPQVKNNDGVATVYCIETGLPGSVIIGGFFDSVGGTVRNRLAKISTSTALADAAWDPAPNRTVLSLALRQGSLYVAGSFSQIGGVAKKSLAKIDSSGSGAGDPSWLGVTESAGFPSVSTIVIGGDRLYAGGKFDQLAGQTADKIGILDLENNGAAIASEFDLEEDPGAGTIINQIVLDGDSLLVAGTHAGAAVDSCLSLARYNRFGGASDVTFTAQIERAGSAYAIIELPDGSLVVGGNFFLSKRRDRRFLVRVNPDGTLHPWNPEPDGLVSCLGYSDGHVYIGGSFENVGTAGLRYLARLPLASDQADPVWAPNPSSNGQVTRMLVHQGVLYVSGHFAGFNGGIGGQAFDWLAKLDLGGTGAADPSWNPTVKPRSGGFLVADDTYLYVGGSVIFDNPPLVRIGLDTGITDMTWLPTVEYDFGTATIASLVLSDDHLYVGGVFSRIESIARRHLVRFTLDDGELDAIWNPNSSGGVRGMALSGDGAELFAAGSFTSIGGAARQYVAAISTEAAATAVAGYDFSPDQTVEALAGGAGDSVYIGGRFEEVSGVRRQGFARLTRAGAPLVVEDPNVRILPTGSNADAITHFKLVAISGGTLSVTAGSGAIAPGSFIDVVSASNGLIWQPDPGAATHQITVVASVSDEDSGVGAEQTIANLSGSADLAVIGFGRPEYHVSGEGALSAKISVTRTGALGGEVAASYTLTAGTAGAFDGASGDFANFPGNVTFGPNETLKEFSVLIVADTEIEGDETFTATLSGPTNGAVLSAPTTVVVTIVDNDIVGGSGSSLTLVPPNPALPAAALGILEINLVGDGGLGQWRLIGEVEWRDSVDDGGSPASGLTTGNYLVEFRPVDGLLEPFPLTVPVDGASSNPAATATANYTGISLFGAGTSSLSATLEPISLATAPAIGERAQWRRQGEGFWRDSGDVISGLAAGIHVIEFKLVDGHITPRPRLVNAQADQQNTVSAVYLFETDLLGAIEPQALSSSPGSSDEPYRYNGQIYTEQGFGSGVITKEHTVLTAAHVVFDDLTLTHVKTIRWFHQRQRGTYDLPPQRPRGWYRFDGYASQRSTDVRDAAFGAGVGSPTSQNLDAAALYFLEAAGRGGSGGYLVSNEGATNPWLLSARDKFHVGYPMEGIAAASRGKMHATPANDDSYSHLQNFVFKTTDIKSTPGSSGGSIYVRADNGNFYPAAIFLGGSGDSVVRAIDDGVVDLMNRAETAGSGGGNSTGGGLAYTEPGSTDDVFSRGRLTASMMGATSGAWRVVDADGSPLTRFFLPDEFHTIPPGDLNVEFRPVAGFVTPIGRGATVYINQTTQLTVAYRQDMDAWTQIELVDGGVTTGIGPLDDYDKDGLVHLIERAFNLSPTQPAQSALDPVAGTSGLPFASVMDLGNGDRVTLTFIRLHPEVAPDISYSPVFADSLTGPFVESGQIPVVEDIGTMWQRVTVQDDFNTSARPARFARVQVTLSAEP